MMDKQGSSQQVSMIQWDPNWKPHVGHHDHILVVFISIPREIEVLTGMAYHLGCP